MCEESKQREKAMLKESKQREEAILEHHEIYKIVKEATELLVSPKDNDTGETSTETLNPFHGILVQKCCQRHLDVSAF